MSQKRGVWRFGDEVQYGNDGIAVLIQELLDFTFASAQHLGPLRCGQEHRHDYRVSLCLYRLAYDLKMDVGNKCFVKAEHQMSLLATDFSASPHQKQDVSALRTTT